LVDYQLYEVFVAVDGEFVKLDLGKLEWMSPLNFSTEIFLCSLSIKSTMKSFVVSVRERVITSSEDFKEIAFATQVSKLLW